MGRVSLHNKIFDFVGLSHFIPPILNAGFYPTTTSTKYFIVNNNYFKIFEMGNSY